MKTKRKITYNLVERHVREYIYLIQTQLLDGKHEVGDCLEIVARHVKKDEETTIAELNIRDLWDAYVSDEHNLFEKVAAVDTWSTMTMSSLENEDVSKTIAFEIKLDNIPLTTFKIKHLIDLQKEVFEELLEIFKLNVLSFAWDSMLIFRVYDCYVTVFEKQACCQEKELLKISSADGVALVEDITDVAKKSNIRDKDSILIYLNNKYVNKQII